MYPNNDIQGPIPTIYCPTPTNLNMREINNWEPVSEYDLLTAEAIVNAVSLGCCDIKFLICGSPSDDMEWNASMAFCQKNFSKVSRWLGSNHLQGAKLETSKDEKVCIMEIYRLTFRVMEHIEIFYLLCSCKPIDTPGLICSGYPTVQAYAAQHSFLDRNGYDGSGRYYYTFGISVQLAASEPPLSTDLVFALWDGNDQVASNVQAKGSPRLPLFVPAPVEPCEAPIYFVNPPLVADIDRFLNERPPNAKLRRLLLHWLLEGSSYFRGCMMFFYAGSTVQDHNPLSWAYKFFNSNWTLVDNHITMSRLLEISRTASPITNSWKLGIVELFRLTFPGSEKVERFLLVGSNKILIKPKLRYSFREQDERCCIEVSKVSPQQIENCDWHYYLCFIPMNRLSVQTVGLSYHLVYQLPEVTISSIYDTKLDSEVTWQASDGFPDNLFSNVA